MKDKNYFLGGFYIMEGLNFIVVVIVIFGLVIGVVIGNG